MSEHAGSLLVVKTERHMRSETRERICELLSPVAKQMGMKALVLDGGLDAGVHSDLRPLIEDQLSEQRKTNHLLVMLIEALAEAEGDPGAEPTTYLDGAPVHG